MDQPTHLDSGPIAEIPSQPFQSLKWPVQVNNKNIFRNKNAQENANKTVNETVNNMGEMMLMGFSNEYNSGYSFEI